MSDIIGFIGVGRMGSALAGRLLDSGRSVVVFDVDRDRVEEMVGAGAEPASDAGTVVERADVVFTSLPRDEVVERVYLDDGLLERATDGTLFVETSTIKPGTIEAIAERTVDLDADVRVLDVPLIGVPTMARAGELTILVGGSEEGFRRIRPHLEVLSEELRHVGDVGHAKAIKLANNTVIYGNYAVVAAAFALGDRLGIDREEFFEIVDGGAAHSTIAATKLPAAFDGDFQPGFTVDGALKDLRYALDLAGTEDHRSPLIEAVTVGYEFAARRGVGDRDYSVLLEVLSDAGGVDG